MIKFLEKKLAFLVSKWDGPLDILSSSKIKNNSFLWFNPNLRFFIDQEIWITTIKDIRSVEVKRMVNYIKRI